MSYRDAMLEEHNYWMDGRTQAAMRASHAQAYDVKDSGPHSAILVLNEDLLAELIDEGHLSDGHSGEFTVQTHFEVCGNCRGSGKTVNPSIDASGLTSEDFAEDPDFRDDYFGGTYDIVCAECSGHRVVAAFDLERDLPGPVVKAIRFWEDSIAESVYTEAYERAHGA